jgi:hypothetical protein
MYVTFIIFFYAPPWFRFAGPWLQPRPQRRDNLLAADLLLSVSIYEHNSPWS